MMDIKNFHDGHFDGFLLQHGKAVDIYLRASDEKPYVLSLKGVRAVTLSGVKAGNIIFNLVVRTADGLTVADVRELFDVGDDPERIAKLVDSTRSGTLQILELNPSYGAEGLFLFETFEIKEI